MTHYIHQVYRVSVCLLGCNFKFIGTLVFISAVSGTFALLQPYNKLSTGTKHGLTAYYLWGHLNIAT